MAPPTPTSARTRPGRARFALVVVLAVLALLAACSTISSLTGLIEDLQDAGFTDVTANVDRSDASVLVVSADAPTGTSTAEAQDQAAEVVWNEFPRRFEGLRVSIDGEGRRWSHAELVEQLGPRPDGLDSKGDLGDDVNRIAVFAILGTLAAGVIGIGLIGLIVFLVVRSKRRNAASRPWARPEPWMPPGIPQGPASGAYPVPPPGGWAPASAPPGPPTPSPPTPNAPTASPPAAWPAAPSHPTWPAASAPTGPSLAKDPAGPEPADGHPDPSGAPHPGPQPSVGGLQQHGGPAGTGPVPPAPPVAPAGPRRRDPDARRLGRRPRHPAPDKAHTPPGWG